MNKYEKLSTIELEQLLKNDCDGVGPLPEADILAICEILVRQQPVSRSAQAAWQQFLRCYAPPEDTNTQR